MKKLLALVALVAMVAISSVAFAQDSTLNASVSPTSSFDATGCTTMASLALSPAIDANPDGYGLGYDYDTQNCNLTVASNAAGWSLTMAETSGGATLVDSVEAGMLYNAANTSHPDVIADCVDGGSGCDLTSVPTHSAFGLWYDGSTTPGGDVSTYNANTVAAPLGSSVNIVNLGAGSATSGGAAENLVMNIGAVVDEEVTANTGYTDGVTFTFTAAT